MKSFLKSMFGRKEMGGLESSHPEMMYLVDRMSHSLNEKFRRSKVTGEEGYLSKSKSVGILPREVFPHYKRELDEAQLTDFEETGDYLGFLGGTLVKARVLRSVTDSLRKENRTYRIFVNRRRPMPLIVSTKDANIVVAHMVSKGNPYEVFDSGDFMTSK